MRSECKSTCYSDCWTTRANDESLTIESVRKDMILPLSRPIKTVSGPEITEIIVPNGTTILLSVLGANTNPEMWGKDSYEWKPERWLNPLPDKVIEAHMPGIYSHL